MKPGETFESAIWLDGCETPEMVRQFKADVVDTIDRTCVENHLLRAPVRFIEKKPGDNRVPPVPDHIQGLDVRLLVGEADITGYAPRPTKRAFVSELEQKDLDQLRAATRHAFEVNNSGQSITDMQCDDVIEELGPETALRTLGSGVN